MRTPLSLKAIMSILAATIALSFFSCASTGTSEKDKTEKLLKASGFKMGLADTKEKLDQLKKLPQRKVFSHQEGDKIFYIYADAENCQCAYSGDEEAYSRYQKLTHEKRLSEEEQREALKDERRQMDLNDWSFDQAW